MKKKAKGIKPRLFIAGIAGANPPIQFTMSLVAMVGIFNRAGIICDIDLRPGGPYIAKERNISVSRFMASEATHMLFIDTDLAWDPQAALRMFVEMCKDQLHLIGGLYRYKMDGEDYPCQLHLGDDNKYIEKGNFLKAAGLPTGFMIITRECIKQMMESYPETKYSMKTSTGEVIMTVHSLFDTLKYEDDWWGEDYVFCRRWAAIGGEMWAYPNIDFSHINFNYGHHGNFYKYYTKKQAELEKV